MRVCVCAFVRALAPFSFSFAWRAFVYAPRVLHSNFCVWLRGCAFVCLARDMPMCGTEEEGVRFSACLCGNYTRSKQANPLCVQTGGVALARWLRPYQQW